MTLSEAGTTGLNGSVDDFESPQFHFDHSEFLGLRRDDNGGDSGEDLNE